MIDRIRHLLTVIAIATCLTACGDSASTSSSNTVETQHHLSVLAGSELKDIEPLLPEIERATGVKLDLTYKGTLSGIDAIENGDEKPDVAWFAQDRYFGLTDTTHLIKKSTQTMISPVILGVKRSTAQKLGWIGRSVSWKDVEAAVVAGKFRYAMTNPATSNSGLAAVIGITSAFTHNGDAINTRDVNQKKLTDFFAGQKLMSGSSGWLADAYQKAENNLDGMINYESVILALNDSKSLQQPLVQIYPQEGSVIADYPLVLLNDVKSDAYGKVIAFIRTTGFQKELMEHTHRRPILPQIALAPEFGNQLLIDSPFPASRSTVDAMINDYLNKHRLPAHTFYVLDKTGSMKSTDGTNESRIEHVQDALNVLTGGDASLTGKLAQFDDRERVTIITFSDQVEQDQTFDMKRPGDPAVFAAVKEISDGLQAGGNTAIYEALERALDEADADTTGRYESIVLMTDGENTRGEDAEAFVTHYQQRKHKIRIFPIFIGEARPQELQKIADISGGQAFDARKRSLVDVFKDIRGYQ